MITNDIYTSNGGLIINRLEEKINSSFIVMQTYINELTDKIVVKELLGVTTVIDVIGDLRRLLFFLIMVDRERAKDIEIDSLAAENLNSFYIEKYNTEAIRKFYSCRVDKNIVDQLFDIFDLEYNNPELNRNIGIENCVIEGAEVPFKIY
ncbi:MAG: hypothetical protein JXR64_02915 [Spirochaetales bacterium]|nr:hypothetical protein [Spirochaetales bacterium]